MHAFHIKKLITFLKKSNFIGVIMFEPAFFLENTFSNVKKLPFLLLKEIYFTDSSCLGCSSSKQSRTDDENSGSILNDMNTFLI